MIDNIIKWAESTPEKCQVCDNKLDGVFIDGRMKGYGNWAIMCPKCHQELGAGLGIGKGHMYKSVWVKIGG
jgi:hypothetical protein